MHSEMLRIMGFSVFCSYKLHHTPQISFVYHNAHVEEIGHDLLLNADILAMYYIIC